VATDGNNYFITWKDNREGTYNGYYSMVSNNGTIIVPETAFTTGANIEYGPKTIWNGSEFIVVWKNNNYSLQPETYCFPEIMFTKFDSSGNKTNNEKQVVTGTNCFNLHVFDIISCSNETAMAFGNYPTINLVKIDNSGNKTSIITTITDPYSSAGQFSMACNNNGYSIAFEDHRDNPPGLAVGEIYYAQADSNGNKIGNDLRVTINSDGSSNQNEDYEPAIACHDQECGIIWTGEFWYKTTKFIRVAANGSSTLGAEKSYNQSEYYTQPTMLWNGSNYTAAWTTQIPNSGTKQQLYMARLDSNGNALNITNLIHPGFTVTAPAIIFDEEQGIYGLSWTDGRDYAPNIDNNWEIYFSVVGCQ
jgi:hypothetical protein